jgi:hypothetical protein
MFDEAELRRMTSEERTRLKRALARLDAPRPFTNPVIQRRRKLVIAFTLLCMVVLAVWIGVLAVTLPPHFRSGGWRTAWVGFDVALLLVFAAAAWAAWRRRQILIMCLVVLATLLCADAWFDATLNWGTRGFMLSLVTALVVELPLAGLMLLGTRRLMRLTLGRMEALEGMPGPPPPFWRVPLFGDQSLGYRHLLHRGTECSEAAGGEDCDEGEPRPAPRPRGVPQPGDVGRPAAAGEHPSRPWAARAHAPGAAALGPHPPQPAPADVPSRAEAS